MGTVQRKTLETKTAKAAKLHYENKGYEVIDENFKTKYSNIGLVARSADKSTIVFVKVILEDDMDKGLPQQKRPSQTERQTWEKKAAAYLVDHDFVDASVRFDEFAALIVKEDRALIRCHQNWFGTDEIIDEDDE